MLLLMYLQDSNLQSFIISEYTIEFAVCVTSTLRIVDFGLRGEIRTHDLRYLDIAARIELASIVSISIALHYAKRCKTGVLPDCTTRRITRHALEKFFYSQNCLRNASSLWLELVFQKNKFAVNMSLNWQREPDLHRASSGL